MVGVAGNDPALEQPSAAKALIRRSRALHLRRIMVRVAGFDPAASCSRNRRSAKLSYTLILATLRGYDPRPSRRQREILPLNYRALVNHHGNDPCSHRLRGERITFMLVVLNW